MTSRPRVVLDCNVILQAIAFETGPSAACLRLMERRRIEVIVSNPVLREMRDVLDRPAVRAVSPALTDERIAAFLQRFAFLATRLRRVPRRFNLTRDPHDEPYLNLAIAGRATHIVTRDRDLLSLMTSKATDGKRFRTYRIAILDPASFIAGLDRE